MINLFLLSAAETASTPQGSNFISSKDASEPGNYETKIIYLLIAALLGILGRIIWSHFRKTAPLESLDHPVTRECLIQSARVLIVDDEEPLLIGELKSEGFAVDHDREGKDLHNIENQIYDLAILDYAGVGQRLGGAQGLDLLKHIKRVSPRTRLIAYTSRSLNATESEFFRLSHAVLPKDMGLGDSLALIETELRKSFSKEHLFEALLAKLSLTNGAEREKVHAALTKALAKNDEAGFKEAITKIAGAASEKAAEMIISKLFPEK